MRDLRKKIIKRWSYADPESTNEFLEHTDLWDLFRAYDNHFQNQITDRLKHDSQGRNREGEIVISFWPNFFLKADSASFEVCDFSWFLEAIPQKSSLYERSVIYYNIDIHEDTQTLFKRNYGERTEEYYINLLVTFEHNLTHLIVKLYNEESYPLDDHDPIVFQRIAKALFGTEYH